MANPGGRFDGGCCLDGIRVLVVDDDRDVRGAVIDILTDGGATVTAVGSAEEALAALQAERPDVLLSDVAMPDKSGYWLITQVRALRPEHGGVTPAAAFTATGPEHRASILRAGFQLHVEKPFGLDGLIQTVATLALKAHAPERTA